MTDKTKKQWETPQLTVKSIDETRGDGQFNEGVGKGKGSSGPIPVS